MLVSVYYYLLPTYLQCTVLALVYYPVPIILICFLVYYSIFKYHSVPGLQGRFGLIDEPGLMLGCGKRIPVERDKRIILAALLEIQGYTSSPGSAIITIDEVLVELLTEGSCVSNG